MTLVIFRTNLMLLAILHLKFYVVTNPQTHSNRYKKQILPSFFFFNDNLSNLHEKNRISHRKCSQSCLVQFSHLFTNGGTKVQKTYSFKCQNLFSHITQTKMISSAHWVCRINEEQTGVQKSFKVVELGQSAEELGAQ